MKRFAALVVVNALVLVTGVVAVLAAPQRQQLGTHSDRLFGKDRYETAVAISRLRWNDQNTTTVFLANGRNFPDALALGTSTNNEGPILLTPPDQLPLIVGREITRLQPCRIIAVGGPTVIRDDVVRAAEARTSRTGCP